MSGKYHRLLESMRYNNPILAATQAGVEPVAIKAWVIEVLAPMFEDKHILAKHAIDVFVPEAVRVSKISQEPWAYSLTQSVLYMYRSAKGANSVACAGVFQEWWNEVEAGVSRFWSLHNLESDLTHASQDDIVFSRFELLGALLEASIQPFLRELLSILRILEKKSSTAEKIRSLDFGVVVDQLSSVAGVDVACAPPPWNIRISQWRNIAQHNSYSVSGNSINVRYGKVPNTKCAQLTFSDLEELARKVALVFMAFGSARSIFTAENHAMFGVWGNGLNIRGEARLLTFASALASQGFELTDFQESGCSVTVGLRETFKGPATHRAAHAIQLLLPLWSHFPKETVQIIYLNPAESVKYTLTVAGKQCDEHTMGITNEEQFVNSVHVDIAAGVTT